MRRARQVLAAIALLATFGCGGNKNTPPDVQVQLRAKAAIDGLGVLAKGIEGAAEAKPPVITIDQAHDALDLVRAAVTVLGTTPYGAYAVFKATLEQLEKLPFGVRLKPYLDVARITLAALAPPQALRGRDGRPVWNAGLTMYCCTRGGV